MIIFALIISLIFVIFNKQGKIRSTKIETNTNILIKKIDLIQNNNEYEIPDNVFEIIVLIFFAAFFEFFGFLSRRFITIYNIDDDNYDEFNAKFRGLEIISSSILCYFTLRIKIYKHHIFSLIIITFCLITNFIIESIKNDTKFLNFLLKIVLVLGSSLSRAYLDTIEKYLFETDYINVFNLILIEQFFNLIFGSSLYFFQKPRKQIRDLFEDADDIKFSIILLIVYGILTAFKNIYRRYTVKQYSPMSRALAESCIDPLLITFEILETTDTDIEKGYFIITLISIFIIIFCCCVYNEAFVLYCCDLDFNTYLEISKRAKLINDVNVRDSSVNFRNNSFTNSNKDKEKELIENSDNDTV